MLANVLNVCLALLACSLATLVIFKKLHAKSQNASSSTPLSVDVNPNYDIDTGNLSPTERGPRFARARAVAQKVKQLPRKTARAVGERLSRPLNRQGRSSSTPPERPRAHRMRALSPNVRVKQRFGLGGRIAVREVNDAQMEIQFDPLKRGP